MPMKPVTEPRTSVSSSKIAAILGHSHFNSIHTQWLYDTKQRQPSFTATARQKMGLGTKLEPIIKELVEEHLGVTITVDKTHYMHDDYDFFRVEFDGLDYENEIVYEFKNTEMDEDILREQYYPQVQFAMFISGFGKARLCYLRSGWDLGYVDIERDENFIENMVKAGKYYWECVRDVVPPDEEYLESIAADIDFYKQFEKEEAEPVEMSDEEVKLLHEWGELKRKINDLQIEEARYKGMFIDKPGTFKDDTINYSNKDYERKGQYDIVALKKDFPDIDFEQYRKRSSSYTKQTLKYKNPSVKVLNQIKDIV